jgi:hypothetical protein
MSGSIEYLILGVLVFGVNIVPAFMPPTWIILAFFYLRYHLNLLPTVIIGAAAATLGRVVLLPPFKNNSAQCHPSQNQK